MTVTSVNSSMTDIHDVSEDHLARDINDVNDDSDVHIKSVMSVVPPMLVMTVIS
jgi:hypothetical protein